MDSDPTTILYFVVITEEKKEKFVNLKPRPLDVPGNKPEFDKALECGSTIYTLCRRGETTRNNRIL